MDKETSYIEKVIKNISSDKNRMYSLIFGALSLICSLIYVVSMNLSGAHLIFVLTLIGAAAMVILYTMDAENKIKYGSDCVVFGIAVAVIGLILKVVMLGIAFSLEYWIGYSVYAIAFLMLCIYLTKNAAKPKMIKVLLLVCAVWSDFEFFYLSSSFIPGIVWKIFRFSEAFLAISYFFLLSMLTKNNISMEEKIGNYKKQIPSLKICIAILLVIAIVSGAIGMVMETTKKTVSVENNTVTEETVEKEKPKKSTVISTTESSTVVPAEEKPAEIKEIGIGDTIETSSYSLKLNKVEISRRVEPDVKPSYYTYYQAEKDHTYIYVNASVTNKEKHSLECDEIYSVTADFDGGYEYNGFNIADDYDGDFTYANITSVEPLETLGVHCLIDCPQLIEEEGKSLFITINLNDGSKYKYIIK